MDLYIFLFTVLLFFCLTPGIFLSLPPKGSKRVVALTHAVVFAIVWTLIHKTVMQFGSSMGWTRPRNGNNHLENFVENYKPVQLSKEQKYVADKYRQANDSDKKAQIQQQLKRGKFK